MKILVLSNRDDIFKLRNNEKYIHLAFRPCSRDFFIIVERCPKIELIQLPHSYFRIIAKSLTPYFKAQRLKVIEGTVWGHRKDLNEYYELPEYTIETINNLLELGISKEEIVSDLTKEFKISIQLANYIFKNAEAA